MGLGLGLEVGFDNDDNIEQLGKFLVTNLSLINLCLHAFVAGALTEKLLRHLSGIELLSIFAISNGALVGKVQGRVVA